MLRASWTADWPLQYPGTCQSERHRWESEYSTSAAFLLDAAACAMLPAPPRPYMLYSQVELKSL